MPFRYLVLAALLVMIAFDSGVRAEGTASAPAAKFADLTVEAYERMAAEPGVVLLDVRTPEEFAAGHLKGAILIDIKSPDFAKKIGELKKDATYLVYCRSGRRSVTACNEMSAQGFGKLYNMLGGTLAWSEAKKPVEK